jgi:hypothetical protein
VKEQVKKLVELQTIDKDIYEFKRELQDKPLALNAIKELFDQKKAKLSVLEEQAKRIQVERKSQELELQAKEGDIAKANSALSQIKTNKEYTAKLKEIESIKADKSIIEEKILLFFDEADQINAQIADEKKVLAEEEKRYLEQKKQVEISVQEIQSKVTALDNQREQILPDVDPQTLAHYERILKNKEGLAIVPVQGNTCGGCYMHITDQVIIEIKMHEKLAHCEMCARILYIEEDL